MDEHALKIWIDGSAYHNPGKDNGLAGYLQYPDAWDMPPKEIFREGYEASNIARMELMACIRALEYVRKHRDEWRAKGLHRIQILTDSQYVHNNVNNVPRWIKEKGRGASGQPIANMDLWRRLNSLRQTVPAEITWHPGKTNEYNKMVDKLAKAGARSTLKKKDSGFRSGKVSRSPVGPGQILPYPAHGDTATIKVYRYGIVDSRLKEKRVIFSVQDSVSGNLAGKYYAYVRNSDVTRKGMLRVTFGTNPKYPMIESVEFPDLNNEK